jgi:type II secretory pathway component PulF
MPIFEYRAVRLDGKTAEGQLQAEGRQEAFRQMDAKGLRPISLVERGGAEPNMNPGVGDSSPVPER